MNGMVSWTLADGVKVCSEAGVLLFLREEEPSGLSIADCWHPLPARGAVLQWKVVQGLNSRKGASWAE